MSTEWRADGPWVPDIPASALACAHCSVQSLDHAMRRMRETGGLPDEWQLVRWQSQWEQALAVLRRAMLPQGGRQELPGQATLFDGEGGVAGGVGQRSAGR